MITKEQRADLVEALEGKDPVDCDEGLMLQVLRQFDAADKRIAELEAIWMLREKEYALAARMVARKADQLKEANARIAELEAAAQWRPIEEAPKDGKDWFIVARAGTQLRGPAYWCDGRWCQGVHEEPLHFTPTHFCELPDAPALPEGGV